jgi:hypothetical protein
MLFRKGKKMNKEDKGFVELGEDLLPVKPTDIVIGKENLLKALDAGFVKLGKNLIRIDTIKRICEADLISASGNDAKGLAVITDDDTIKIKELEWPAFMSEMQKIREEIQKQITEQMGVKFTDSKYISDEPKAPQLDTNVPMPKAPPLEEKYEHQVETKPVIKSQEKTGTVIPLGEAVMNRTSTVYIDNMDLLSGSGELPLAPGESIVERAQLMVLGRNGVCLGTCTKDGLITGEGVSGHISCTGKYRLVFKEYAFPDATVTYKVKSGGPV